MPSQAKQDQETANPALQALQVLVGTWNMELSNAAFLPPSETVQGQVSFEWIEGGAYLVMHMGADASSAPQAVWLIGRDESAPGYTVLYYDSRRVSRIYQMSFAGGNWKMWRDAPGFSQRFTATLGADATMVKGQWEKSADGTKWEHDFDVTYRKLSNMAKVIAGMTMSLDAFVNGCECDVSLRAIFAKQSPTLLGDCFAHVRRLAMTTEHRR